MTGLAGFLGLAYPWVLAAHITFVIFWMAGLFLLPRFYVYHQETTVGSPEDRAWIDREARVRSIILNPAMAVVWILGLMPGVRLRPLLPAAAPVSVYSRSARRTLGRCLAIPRSAASARAIWSESSMSSTA